jgi:hypothetical protein
VGYDLLAALFFAAMTPVVVVGFIVFWMVNANDHAELASAWRRYAASRGLRFVPPENDWPNRTSPSIAWRHDEAELRISAVGREARVRTRLTIRPRSKLLGTLHAISDPAEARGFRMREHPRGFGARILDDRVTRVFRGFRQHDRLVLTYRRGRVTFEWPGGELSDARLDEARQLGERIAEVIDEQFHAAARASKPAA